MTLVSKRTRPIRASKQTRFDFRTCNNSSESVAFVGRFRPQEGCQGRSYSWSVHAFLVFLHSLPPFFVVNSGSDCLGATPPHTGQRQDKIEGQPLKRSPSPTCLRSVVSRLVPCIFSFHDSPSESFFLGHLISLVYITSWYTYLSLLGPKFFGICHCSCKSIRNLPQLNPVS